MPTETTDYCITSGWAHSAVGVSRILGKREWDRNRKDQQEIPDEGHHVMSLRHNAF